MTARRIPDDHGFVSGAFLKHGALALLCIAASACSREARTLASDQPQTAPGGPQDPRLQRYQANVYQVAQGGRYFTWYGCGACHGADAAGALALGDDQWRHGSAADRVYAFIARGHPGEQARYGDLIPPEQLWQITAYVRELPKLDPARRQRQDADLAGEPQGRQWRGAVAR